MANILIVDDSRTSRKILKGMLESAGYIIVGEATNGEEGVNMYKELSPDLVTLDVTMPVMDGIECLKLIKNENPAAKVVMVTAAGQKSKMIEAITSGADEFISKPLEADKVIPIIDKIVEK